jgi:hypothetical protein
MSFKSGLLCFYRCVIDFGVLVLFHPHCVVYYRGLGLRCVWDQTGMLLVCLSTVSFPL